MVKSTYRKIVQKLMIIVVASIVIGCSQDSFRRVGITDLNGYEKTKGIKWVNNDNSIILFTLIDNGVFLQEYNILLALRYYNGIDSVYYLLRNTQVGNYTVRDNKLYIYDRKIASPGTIEGWYEASTGSRRMIDSVFVTGDSILKSCPNLKSFDKIAKTKPYGIYRIDHDSLRVIAKNKQEQKKYLENIYIPGFYYFSSPGLGLERIYDLSLIEEKLKKNPPSALNPEYY